MTVKTYSKNDRVKIEMEAGLTTVTITSRAKDGDYNAVTGNGIKIRVSLDQIKGLA